MRSKQDRSLLCSTAGNNYAGRPQQTILQTISAPGLANDRSFGRHTRLVGNRFVQIRIKLVAFGFDRFQSVFRKSIVQLRLNENHCGTEPVNSRTSSIILLTIACALSFALARTDCIIRSTPNSSSSELSVSVTPSV